VIADLRTLARTLGGDVVGGQVVAPGPGHSRKDRSLSVAISATAPEGFLAFSHAGDDFAACRDYVKQRLGLPMKGEYRPKPKLVAPPPAAPAAPSRKWAMEMWAEGTEPRGSVVERYLASRGLELDEGLAGEVLRYHRKTNAMLALFRDIVSDEPKAISRTFLTPEGSKIERKFLGPVGGCAIKFDPEEEVLAGLHIGEGIETCLSARQMGLRPAWALGSAGAIAAFPVLSGIECLSFLREHDEANAKAATVCALRWRAAKREVRNVWPDTGGDLNDEVVGAVR
jgi:putative DNA primase/helicase